MNQTMFWLQVTSAFERLWIRVRMWLQRKQLDKDAERDYIRTLQNSRSITTQDMGTEPLLTPEAVEKYKQKIEAMFAPTVFSRGVELSSLQLGFMDLIAVPPQEMRYWLDEFEKRYGQNKDLQSHQMKRLGNMVRDAYTQTSTDRKEVLGSEAQQTAVYTHDRFTVAWLPKLGILPGQSSKGKRVTRATAPVDAGTQTSMFDFDELGPLQNKVYAPFKDRSNRVMVAWAHFVTQISLPDIKVLGPLLHERSTRSVKDLMQQLEVAKMKRVAVQKERQLLERRGTSKEAVGSVASSSSRTPTHTTLAVAPVPSAQSVRGSAPMMQRPSLSQKKGRYED
uniref:Uncharacterized protein n=1 Tax=Alexandrium catenella TaxID=2925 RepID=A0A7S1WA65_ALECA